MDTARLLWIDLSSQSSDHGLVALVPDGYKVVRIDRFDDPAEAVRRWQPFLACVEFDYPDRPGLRVVSALAAAFPELPLAMFTEYHSEELAIWAFRSGVWDYRVKPVSRTTLSRIVDAVRATTGSRPRVHAARRWLPEDLIEPAGHLRRPPSRSQRTGAAVAYISRCFGQQVRRDVLAHLTHLSSSEFSRAFKREQGTTFQRFLLAYRIAKARDFLAEPCMTVSRAAFSAGFVDVSYFSRSFRRLTGSAPSAYRAQVQCPVPRSGEPRNGGSRADSVSSQAQLC